MVLSDLGLFSFTWCAHCVHCDCYVIGLAVLLSVKYVCWSPLGTRHSFLFYYASGGRQLAHFLQPVEIPRWLAAQLPLPVYAPVSPYEFCRARG